MDKAQGTCAVVTTFLHMETGRYSFVYFSSNKRLNTTQIRSKVIKIKLVMIHPQSNKQSSKVSPVKIISYTTNSLLIYRFAASGFCHHEHHKG
ncbi:MAG: hypothetical protein AAGC78_15875 [Cellvibrio sp.]|uniref:hypothetical protein n=1 Tax=Cellvibrio sp. TaxID=1965322 RepID=UPI0031AE0D2B